MKKSSMYVVLSVLTIIFSITGIVIAITSMTLKVKGYTNIASNSWNIHFENLSTKDKSTSLVEVDKPYITYNSTAINGVDIKINDAYDSITYEFDVVNDGGLDARIGTIQVNSPICTGSADANDICKNIKYELTYSDGTKVKEGDTLDLKSRKTMNLRLYFDSDTLPISEVDVNNFSVVIIYIQN